MKRIDGERLRFVLSAGRTGTTFLREFLKARGGALDVAFEPPTSRRCWVLWNAEQAGLAPRGLASRIVIRRRRADALGVAPGRVRLEINSFMSPFVGDLCEHTDALGLVHMVRHPFTWIPSMGNFKAAYWRRHVIDHVPFTHQVHPLARAEWRRLHEVVRLAWRWRLANEGLGVAETASAIYLRVRYEDFVSRDEAVRDDTLAAMLSVVDPAFDGRAPQPDRRERLNARPAGEVPDWRDWDAGLAAEVREICAPLMARYGYGDTP